MSVGAELLFVTVMSRVAVFDRWFAAAPSSTWKLIVRLAEGGLGPPLKNLTLRSALSHSDFVAPPAPVVRVSVPVVALKPPSWMLAVPANDSVSAPLT